MRAIMLSDQRLEYSRFDTNGVYFIKTNTIKDLWSGWQPCIRSSQAAYALSVF